MSRHTDFDVNLFYVLLHGLDLLMELGFLQLILVNASY